MVGMCTQKKNDEQRRPGRQDSTTTIPTGKNCPNCTRYNQRNPENVLPTGHAAYDRQCPCPETVEMRVRVAHFRRSVINLPNYFASSLLLNPGGSLATNTNGLTDDKDATQKPHSKKKKSARSVEEKEHVPTNPLATDNEVVDLCGEDEDEAPVPRATRPLQRSLYTSKKLSLTSYAQTKDLISALNSQEAFGSSRVDQPALKHPDGTGATKGTKSKTNKEGVKSPKLRKQHTESNEPTDTQPASPSVPYANDSLHASARSTPSPTPSPSSRNASGKLTTNNALVSRQSISRNPDESTISFNSDGSIASINPDDSTISTNPDDSTISATRSKRKNAGQRRLEPGMTETSPINATPRQQRGEREDTTYRPGRLKQGRVRGMKMSPS